MDKSTLKILLDVIRELKTEEIYELQKEIRGILINRPKEVNSIGELKHLNEREKKLLKKILYEIIKTKITTEIYLIGSKSRGDCNINSDIDLVIFVEEENESEVQNLITFIQKFNNDNNIKLSTMFMGEELYSFDYLESPDKNPYWWIPIAVGDDGIRLNVTLKSLINKGE